MLGLVLMNFQIERRVKLVWIGSVLVTVARHGQVQGQGPGQASVGLLKEKGSTCAGGLVEGRRAKRLVLTHDGQEGGHLWHRN